MFGIPSITKLLVLAAIIGAVWYGFKWIGRLDAARKNKPVGNDRAGRGGRGAPADVEDTVQCPACGAYVVANATSPCERPDCPY